MGPNLVMLHYLRLDVFAGSRNHLIVGLFQTHQRRYCHFSRGGMEEDDLGEINDFNVGLQSLELEFICNAFMKE